MANAESRTRDAICELGRSLFERGLTSGSSGNISVRLDDGWLMTPTGVSLGRLDPARLAKLDVSGTPVGGDRPTKECPLHLAMYGARPGARAIVHLHSTYSTAVSCLADIDATDALPPLTAYYAMRVGRLPLVPYFPPGDAALASAAGSLAVHAHSLLLANHGPIVAAASLDAAADAVEVLEQTARVFLLLRGCNVRPLTQDEVRRLNPSLEPRDTHGA
jgi:ribulose-5-phosphate 4-epimerase/fuculose-1-phosphate aldolase